MPSHKHELLLELFRNNLSLAPALMQSGLRVELPRYTAARVHSADLTEVRPVEYRADFVLQLMDRKPVLGIIVEVQLSRDSNKLYTWPVYATNLRAKLRCPVHLLVLCPKQSVARWAARPINLGKGTFSLWAIGPEDVPVIDNAEEARALPELAVLSAVVHSQDPDIAKVARIAAAAIDACRSLEVERSQLYFDFLYHSLDEDVRRTLPQMLPANYQYQSDFARKYYGQGKAEGRAEGRVEGQAEGHAEGHAKGSREALTNVVAKLLSLRFGPLRKGALSRIAGATSAELEAIAERLLTAPTLKDALGQDRPAKRVS